MPPRAPLRVLVVAHTHWDREWYQPAGVFRQRLVALIDELLDDPPAEGSSFLLDGQAIVLDDYLAVRAERAAELAALLRDGRLEAGPWFVLADELIPGGEALVRNLLAGRDALRALRAASPPVLYCPDAFGHPAILPDLAAGFGLSLVVAWRGYGGRRWPSGDVVRWRGSAGAELVLYHLAPGGYELGSSLPAEPSDAAARWRALEEVLVSRATVDVALLLNGADHHARQRAQCAAVRALTDAAAPRAGVEPSSLAAAARAIVDSTNGRSLPVIEGELRDSYGYTWTLQGTLAARAQQKRANARGERMLVRDVEPWIALERAGGTSARRALLRATWRALLEGHPHDTLCGTSIDVVAVALDARHADAADQARALREAALGSLLGHDAERARAERAAWRPAVAIRNRVARARGGVVELALAATIADVAVGPGSAARQGARRRVPPWRVTGVPLQLLGRRERVALTESPGAYPDADVVAEVRAVGWIERVDAYAVETRLHGGASAPLPSDVRPVGLERTSLDNGLLRIEVGLDGDVALIELGSGRRVAQAITLEDARDAGDLYTPAIREPLSHPLAPRVRVVNAGPIRGEISIGFRWPRRRDRCEVSLVLDAGAPFVRVRVRGDNASMNHRLRLRIATGLPGASTLADAAFHPIVRRPLEIPPEDAAMEHVVPTAPLQRYVSRYGTATGATIFSDGLAEYESLDDGAVAVTLVRAVGALSRVDLPERPGHAGWPAETPLAQSLGPYEAELAVALHGPDTPRQRDAVERMADDVLLPLVGETLRSNLVGAHAAGGLELVGEGLAFSAALPAREQGWLVLRCVNRSDDAVHGTWRTHSAIAEARLARLDETPLAPLDVDPHAVSFDAPPRAIVTVLLRWADGA
jgi:alpha-mannosidase